ncbi:lipoprotein transmembrane protein [Nitritalea halalkaliphila LW7]|uniref:Lipoprotein transmembrane protein n=1 Tax=Nitritalea halalkaliphila LW7 TaxID=1189621 RepID=I5CAR0_9BACT|nr:bile acid:sodium symporter family protein [Nitritalea halalkaliphila]EIM78912.1 lipoprotein transmembrane protein [Nitritalea halalkaliphila LW7]
MVHLLQTLKKVGFNAFFFLLLSTIALAYAFPELGMESSPVPVKKLTGIGVSLIFFFYGVKLSPQELWKGLRNWKLHLLVQAATFLLFPMFILLLFYTVGAEATPLWLGTFYLAALPSTVSSSVVMVSIARGNLPAAIFNASISSMVGIFLTPLWMELMLPDTAVDFALGETFQKLTLQVLVPLLIGLFFHRLLIRYVERHKVALKNFDQFIILLIVFSAFAESFGADMFAGQSWGQLLQLGLLMLGFFFFMIAIMHGVGKALGLSLPDRITLLFCGSKKSLVQGAVMGRVLFPDPQVFGLILLPLMLYHTLQLMAGSALAQRLGARPVEV